jgi:RNA recognition motif-containing protein
MKKPVTSKDLYVSDIPFEAEEEDLQKLFALCGKVRSIHMVTDEKSGLFKGCAFVHMTTSAEAKDAINTIDGVSLHKRIISVTEALPRKTATPQTKAEPEKTKKTRRPPRRRK